MRCILAYGSGALDVELPATSEVLVPAAATPYEDPATCVGAALLAPVGTPPLAELARGRGSACVVISDATRPAVGPWVLQELLATLRTAGVADVEVLIATGSHRAAHADEIERLLGVGIAGRVPVHNHDAVHGDHVHVGDTRFGTAVWIDARYMRAALRIVVGVVEPHLMAGYSGGPKNVCPGIARLDSIGGVHRAAVARGRVGPGIVVDNPFRAEVFEAAHLAGVDFSVQCCVSRDARPTFVSAGALEPSTARAVEHAAAHSRVSTPRAHDVVVVSGGGAPLDHTLYQAAKGWASGAAVVRAGGDLVLVAELRDGLGAPEFARLLEAGLDSYGASGTASAGTPDTTKVGAPGTRPDGIPGTPSAGDAPGEPRPLRTGQWMLQHILQARRRARLHIVSSQPPERLTAIGLEAHASVPAALAALRMVDTGDVLVLPNGPYCVPTLGERFVTLEGQVMS